MLLFFLEFGGQSQLLLLLAGLVQSLTTGSFGKFDLRGDHGLEAFVVVLK